MELIAIYSNCSISATGVHIHKDMRDWEPGNKNRKEKTLVDRMFDQMDAFTPKRGYNLVRIDPWSIPDDDDALTLVGHFDTYAEAEQALMRYGKHNVTIYGPRRNRKNS